MKRDMMWMAAGLVGAAGLAALWWAWPERTVSLRDAGPSAKSEVRTHGVVGTRTGKRGEGRETKAVRTPWVSTRKEAPAHVRNETDDLQDRCRAVEAWAASGTDEGAEKAIAAAKAESGLRETAVRALGRSGSARAAEYVASLFGDEDPAVVCAAIGAWAALKGEEAIPEIAKILEKNRNRNDECREEIGKACVKALGELGSSGALPVLEKELRWVSQQDSMLGHGADVIEAVADIGDSRGAEMLEGYADELRGKLAGDPVVRRDQMLQMAEALRKADDLR